MGTDAFAATAQGDLAPPPDRLASGVKIGDYVIDRFLGAGAMGEVYAGHHPVIGKKVAIKLLKADLASSAEATERFVREARAVNAVDHPNVIDIFNFGTTETGRLFLIMELVAGTSLRARVLDGPLDVDQALAILGTIAEALDAAHARGVIHRDLKPDNVMLSADTPPKVFVLDFGIARLVSAADAAKNLAGNGTLTGQGTWLGTPGYMAPEQWSSDGAGPASDRYALGVMAFELLAGKLPFVAPNLPAMMEQHFRAPVPALGTRRGPVPIKTTQGDAIATETLDPVLARAMAKNPDERFPTGGAMVEALRLASGTGTGPTVAAPRRPATTKKPWLPAAIGVGVLGAAIMAAVAIRTPAQDPDAPVPAVAPPAGSVAMTITTTPPGAQLVENEHVIGPTPQTIYPRPGEHVTLTAQKPGYEPIATQLVAPPASATEVQRHVGLQLVQMNGFEGIWRLGNGELREFRRAGERVDIFKRDAVTGPNQPYRTYDIKPAAAGAPGFAFAGSEDIVERGAADLRCTIQSTVSYHYDPTADALDVAREHVGTKVEDGHCIVVSRALLPAQQLVRVDGGGDVHYADAPVGRPHFDNIQKIPPQDPSPDNTFDDKLDGRRKPGDDKSIQKDPPPAPPINANAPKAKTVPIPKQAPPVTPPVKGASNTAKKPQVIGEGNAKDNASKLQQQMPQPQVPTANPDVEPAAQQQQAPPQQQKSRLKK